MKTIVRLLILGWFFMIIPPGGNPQVIGPYNSLRGCRDWLGSCLYHHPPACHDNPSPVNCMPDGPGFGGGFCSEDCSYIGHQGWFYFSLVDGLHGPFGKHHCGQFGYECFFVGNTGE